MPLRTTVAPCCARCCRTYDAHHRTAPSPFSLITGRDGAAEAIMAARFGVEVLAGLVRKGWASVDVETVHAGGRTFDVVRMRITAVGRQALAV